MEEIFEQLGGGDGLDYGRIRTSGNKLSGENSFDYLPLEEIADSTLPRYFNTFLDKKLK